MNSTKPNGQQLKAKPQQHARSLKAAGALLTSVHHSSLKQLLQDTGAELAEKGIAKKHSKHGKGRARQQEDQQQAMEAAPMQQQPQQQPAAIMPPATVAAAAQPAADINALLGNWSLKQPKELKDGQQQQQEDQEAAGSAKQSTAAQEQQPVCAGAIS
jgi:hypothetical protein